MTTESAKSPSRALHVGLWVAQALLALMFGMAGAMKLTAPIDKLAETMDWVRATPWLPRFIGAAELAGALGMILPSATRIKPVLTPFAAVGLATIMVLAAGLHLAKGEASHVAPVIVLFSLSVWVAWGRFRGAPIAPR
jgi:uncharacterized membrane protein YphA (DoxX/SURF4 family)